MEPKRVGRALGVGVRVASKMVQQRMAEASQAQASQKTADLPVPPSPSPTNVRRGTGFSGAKPGGRALPQAAGWWSQALRGLQAFWRAFLGPFTHAGSILWLEITGLFFALFALLFVQNAYRVRDAWRGGPNQMHLLLYVAVAAGFVWFSASSFVRARGKSKRGPVTR